jgi:alginate O-acetyltransferase complex protein AlgI
MVFSSHIFIYYLLPVSLLLYYVLPRWGKYLSLSLLSYVFYGWTNPKFIPLMFITITVDYLAGRVQAHNGFRGWRQPIRRLEPGAPRTAWQKGALVASVVANLALLGFFKYFNFGVDNINNLAGMLHLPQFDAMHVILPLGISFYTFQAMSYSIDVYRGDTVAMRSYLLYTTFVSQYQQLVAGPIVRFSEIADQLRSHTHTLDKFARGVAVFSCGLAMKVLLANPCGKVADTIFTAGAVGPMEAWYGALAYSFQIFFDFAGYSEMAVGLGLFMGFVFPKNFDRPYRAESITDFWHRWHISLSTWLRDYLYIPLGGNRKGEGRALANLGIVMLLGGLWHGASWNFVIWGGVHGGMLAFERTQGNNSLYARVPKLARIALTFLVVLVAWVFFRAADLPAALAYLGHMANLGTPAGGGALVAGLVYKPYYLVSVALAAVVAFSFPTVWQWTQHITWPKALACLGLLWLALIMLATQAYNPFIYFIF